MTGSSDERSGSVYSIASIRMQGFWIVLFHSAAGMGNTLEHAMLGCPRRLQCIAGPELATLSSDLTTSGTPRQMLHEECVKTRACYCMVMDVAALDQCWSDNVYALPVPECCTQLRKEEKDIRLEGQQRGGKYPSATQ